MNMLRENMRIIAECSQQLVRLGENLLGKGATEKDVSFDTESEWLKHEITLPEGYIFKDENGNVINATKIVLEKKKKEYPKNYKECCKVLGIEGNLLLISTKYITDYERGLWNLMGQLHGLIICRDAYWKIAGEKNKGDIDYVICNVGEKIINTNIPNSAYNHILSFPTEEMRDAFYENFKELIDQCKELL